MCIINTTYSEMFKDSKLLIHDSLMIIYDSLKISKK